VSAALSNRELDIANALQKTGLSLPEATLAVVMAVREHARPVSELADIVRQYQNLEQRPVAEQAIRGLERMKWLVESESYGTRLIHVAPDLRDFIACRLSDPDLAQQLSEMRSYLLPTVRVIGTMNDRDVYQTYLESIRGAQKEICLPMLATSPNLSSVPLLQERASKGVKVRILLGSPKLTGKLRGATMVSTAKDSIQGWTRNAENHPGIQVRISNSSDDMQVATCMLVDGRLLRFDVYDPSRQRSLEGIMIDLKSPSSLELNIIQMFRVHFDRAWKNAKSTSPLGTIFWNIRRGWRWYCFGIFALLMLLAARTGKSNWAGVFSSASATFLVNAFVTSFESIRSFLRSLRDLE